MLINSDDIKQTKQYIEVMQAFIDGKEIEFKQDSYKGIWKDCTTPIWDFREYKYRIKHLDKKRYKNFTREPYIHSDSFWENSKPIEKTHNVPFFHSIMADQFVELGIELPDYIVKQLSPEKLDYLTRKAERLRKETGYPKFDESIMEDTVVKQSEPEYTYPIYKRLKETPETIVEFTGLDSGIYVSTHDKSIYRPGYPALNMAPHTDSSWEDYTVSIDAEKIILGQSTTEELFEVMVYCDIVEEYSIRKSLYSNEELEYLKHHQKTGRSFILDKDTKQIIKVVNK